MLHDKFGGGVRLLEAKNQNIYLKVPKAKIVRIWKAENVFSTYIIVYRDKP